MPEIDDQMEQAKREMFGNMADKVMVQQVGSGISETTRFSLNIFNDPELLANMPAPWTENRDMIVKLFTPIFERSWTCPGKNRVQCCHAEAGQACFPNWQEREDPEWYAQRLNLLLSQVNSRITQEGTHVSALAADEGFELGSLFTEALIKFQWDQHAKRGAKVLGGTKIGGDMRRLANNLRQTAEETVEAVSKLIDSGVKPMKAYRQIARAQGVS